MLFSLSVEIPRRRPGRNRAPPKSLCDPKAAPLPKRLIFRLRWSPFSDGDDLDHLLDTAKLLVIEVAAMLIHQIAGDLGNLASLMVRDMHRPAVRARGPGDAVESFEGVALWQSDSGPIPEE